MTDLGSGHTQRQEHRRRVAEYFSENLTYWKTVYRDPPRADGSPPLFDMKKRKEQAVRAVDDYAEGHTLTILDAGCGPGVILEDMLKRGHRIVGLDISENSVREANDRLRLCGADGPCCLRADIEDIPLAGNCVDVVLCLGVLPWLLSDARALGEMSRVVKKGGLIILALPNLLRIGSLLDPYYYLCRVWQYLWHRVDRAGRRRRPSEPARHDLGTNRDFRVRRYLPGSLNGEFRRHRLSVSGSWGVEYGPLTFWRRSFLSEGTSRSLDSRLARLSEKKGFSWLRAVAGQTLICLNKL